MKNFKSYGKLIFSSVTITYVLNAEEVENENINVIAQKDCRPQGLLKTTELHE